MPENIEVQYLFVKGTVEPLHIQVLCRLAGLDEFKVNPMLFGSSGKLYRDKLWTVVRTHFYEVVSSSGYAVKRANDTGRRQVGVHFHTNTSRLQSSSTLNVRKR